ncbi:hypothetical protein MBLNU13_g06786t1 [Cladosporium sp. NU13]
MCERKIKNASRLESSITEGCRGDGDRCQLSLVHASTDGESVDSATSPGPTKIYPASCSQNERATGTFSPMEACQGECTYAGNRTGYPVDDFEQIHQASFRPAKDSNKEPLQSGGRSWAKAKKFLKENGPRMAKAAVMIGMFVFNVVSVCC